MDVVGLGQVSFDHVCLVDGLPAFAGKDRILAYRTGPGGQVATALLACSRLGLRAAFLGSVGDDPAARAVLEPLEAAGIDTQGVVRVAGAPTQIGILLVDRKSGERTVLWHRDPKLSLQGVPLEAERIRQGRALHLDASDPSVSTWAARVAREAGIPVLLDADADAPGMSELLRHVDFPIVSRDFAEKHFGTSRIREALARLVELGARMAVVTLGERGALARTGERLIASPAFPVTVRDTTGAGDVFHAAFAWGLLQGFDAERILRVANAAAGMNCRAMGAQGGLARQAELESFLVDNEPGPWRDPDEEGERPA